jgi:hypothetical protein
MSPFRAKVASMIATVIDVGALGESGKPQPVPQVAIHVLLVWLVAVVAEV